MKISILRVIGLLFLLASTYQALAQKAVAVDSVAEKAAVKRLSESMCTLLEQENQQKPLVSLSQEEAMKLFAKLSLKVISADDEMLTKFTCMGDKAQGYGRQLGRQIGLYLLGNCPVSQPLFMRLGGQQMQQQVPAAEEAVLKPVAAELCRNLQPRIGA